MLLVSLAVVFAVQPGVQLRGASRKVVLQHTAAAAFSLLSVPRCHADEPFSGSYAKQGITSNSIALGSKGISAYEKLKVDGAIKDLAEAVAAANDAKLTPTLNYFAALLPLVKEEKLDRIEEKSIQLAVDNLVALASGNESFEGQAASIGKRSATLLGACKKGDEGGAALAVVKLATELADFAFGWASSDRPLKAIDTGSIPLMPRQ